MPNYNATNVNYSEDGYFEHTVFPSRLPTTRQDIQLLERWLGVKVAHFFYCEIA